VIFTATALPGVVIVEPEARADERGLFARTFCAREFAAHGLETRVAQSSVSFNPRRGTLRGLHYQAPPHAEAKLVRCTRGEIFDVALDLRPDSPAFKRHVALVLTAADRRALYVPPGCAHGFETLADDCEVLYQISEFHVPESARGVRWDDPAFAIPWPLPPAVISERDRGYPDFEGRP
jgi:dTDP-4-dehydrorhamnose 3,5-epimerase